MTPTLLIREAIDRFDNIIADAFFRCLLLPGKFGPSCTQDRIDIALSLARLAPGSGIGLGLVFMRPLGPACFLASLSLALSNDLFATLARTSTATSDLLTLPSSTHWAVPAA